MCTLGWIYNGLAILAFVVAALGPLTTRARKTGP